MGKKEISLTPFYISLAIIVSVVVFYVLYIGASVIIPFMIALFFSLAIIALSNFYKKFKLPVFLSFIFSLLSYVFLFWLIGKMIGSNVEDFIEKLGDYQEKIQSIVISIFDYLSLTPPKNIESVFESINLTKIIPDVISNVTSVLSSTGMIFFYVIFILLEYRYFRDKLNLMITDKGRKQQVFEILEKIRNDMKSYFVIKTIVSFITAGLSYIVMLSFHLDFAIFWAFLIFILNFIPNVGSIIALSFPIVISLVQFSPSYYQFIFMSSGLVGIQVLMGNIIEPKFMGNKLNLSPLVIITSLVFWGTLWGVVGMLLSVPIMVTINIILAKIPATRSIAILLSEKGDLQIESTEQVKKTRKKILQRIKGKLKKRKK